MRHVNPPPTPLFAVIQGPIAYRSCQTSKTELCKDTEQQSVWDQHTANNIWLEAPNAKLDKILTYNPPPPTHTTYTPQAIA